MRRLLSPSASASISAHPAALSASPAQGVTPVWDPAPTYTPSSVLIGGTPATITVHNSVRCEDLHLLPVTVTTAQTGGPTTSWVIHLARWVWN